MSILQYLIILSFILFILKMARLLPSLNALRVFDAAARLGSFSRAAEELSVTQSAVSRQIQQLERQLGGTLFLRRGPQISLTETGREYHGIVQSGLAIIRRGTHRLFGAEPTPSITLNTVPSLISNWLVPRLADFERSHPRLSLRLSASTALVDFALQNDIDAAIRFGRGNYPGLAVELLVDDVIFPVCSPDVASKLRKPEDLGRFRLFVEDPHFDLWGYWLEAFGIAELAQSGKRLSDDYNVQLQAAALGHGVALGRGLLAADDLKAGRLVCPFDKTVRSPAQYYFVCPPERLGEEAIRQTLDWLKQAAADTVAGLEAWCGNSVSSAKAAAIGTQISMSPSVSWSIKS